MAKIRERLDYEVTIGLQSPESMQFFSLKTIYPDVTEKQLINSIKLVLDQVKPVAIFKYVYARRLDTMQMIEFEQFPAGITSSTQIKWTDKERERWTKLEK